MIALAWECLAAVTRFHTDTHRRGGKHHDKIV
jgi:hypothetical protein